MDTIVEHAVLRFAQDDIGLATVAGATEFVRLGPFGFAQAGSIGRPSLALSLITPLTKANATSSFSLHLNIDNDSLRL